MTEVVNNSEIAKTVIDQMGNQVDLLVTLATAVFGGLIALFVQVLIHNSEPNKTQITFKGKSLRLVIAALLLEGGSICFAFFARGAITSLTPAIFRVDTSKLDNWTDASLPSGGGFALRVLPTIQFLLFFLGIVTLALFMIQNRHLIGGKKS